MTTTYTTAHHALCDDNGWDHPGECILDEVTPADADGEFLLSDGSFGNPGCDCCGTYDATVRIGSAYFCDECK
jgi:hypothetical protein